MSIDEALAFSRRSDLKPSRAWHTTRTHWGAEHLKRDQVCWRKIVDATQLCPLTSQACLSYPKCGFQVKSWVDMTTITQGRRVGSIRLRGFHRSHEQPRSGVTKNDIWRVKP